MEWYWWAFFLAIVTILMTADLGLFQRKAHEVKIPEALKSTALRVLLALLFGGALYLGWIGGYDTPVLRQKAGLEFLTGYLVEIALSIDNVFIFALLFRFFRVEPAHQHKILFWGILGALVMRAALIFAGIALLDRFQWVIYLFAFVLIYGGIKMFHDDKEEVDPSQNIVVRAFRRIVPLASKPHEGRFFLRENGRMMATPLCLVLVAIETSDLIFAVDSIPAVLSVTRDPFIVLTSNVFAIIGLRALYFALAGILKLFRYLHYGLAAILIFIGVKMLLSESPYRVDTLPSLLVVLGLLLLSIAASLLIKPAARATD